MIRIAVASLVALLTACGGGGGDAPSCAADQLAAVNAARAAGAQCGAVAYGPVPPLVYDERLAAAASAHAEDMAAGGFGSHTGSDGSSVGERATRYGWTAPVGENVAAGLHTYDSAHAALMASAGHCINIMHPRATHFGSACATGKQPYGTYWAQAFGWSKQ